MPTIESIRVDTSRPQILGLLDPAVLAAARRYVEAWAKADPYRDPEIEANWSPDESVHIGSSWMPLTRHKSLVPVAKSMLRVAYEAGYPGVGVVTVELDARDVEPGGTQREAGGWHIDAEAAVSAGKLVVADMLPTEILVSVNGGEQSTISPDEYRELVTSLVTEDDLAVAGLKVWSAQPYEIVDIEGRLHRSPANLGSTSVDRTFVRAELLRKYLTS